MFCSNCGKEIGNSVLCPFCNTISEENRAAAINNSKAKNPAPPAKMPDSGVYGQGNQAPVNNYNNASAYGGGARRNGAAKKDNSTVVIVAIAAVVIVIVLVIAGCFLASMFNDSNKKAIDTYEGEKDEIVEQISTPEPTPEPTPVVKPASSYICVTGGGSWYDAQAAVRNYGPNAHLVTFDSYEEFRFVCDHAKNNGLDYFWAGMKANSLADWEGSGFDVRGELFNKENLIWLTGEPSGYDYNLAPEERIFEDCLVVIYKDGVWVANDAPGTTNYTSQKAGYVIEIE